MVRLTFIFCLMGGIAMAETEATTTPEQDAVAPTCDSCAARKNAKRVLREYMAAKRAEEEAEAQVEAEDKADD